ncbi:MAG: hypothetical protein LBO69_02860 [Ignavibacteria bacterium]|jgi:exopolyphosphatase/guanosine-5'-triphosphate,3'-diphosphate pyrophosphatase|nr:hypothetical protein [Ignavibacteria bacterium]
MQDHQNYRQNQNQNSPINIAAIDIGSNTILMQILQLSDIPTIIADYHGIARLSENINVTQTICPAAIRRASAILSEYALHCKTADVKYIRAVATSAMREASNSAEVVQQLEQAFGMPNFHIDIITGDEEAELSFLGAINALAAGTTYTVIDIGGGSTEIITGNKQHIISKISIPIGVVKLTEQFHITQPVKDALRLEIRHFLCETFSVIDASVHNGELIAVSGTPTALAAIACNINEYDNNKINHFRFAKEVLSQTISLVLNAELTALQSDYSIEKGRADVLSAGAMLLEALVEKLGKDTFIVSTNGLRYGVGIKKALELQNI